MGEWQIVKHFGIKAAIYAKDRCLGEIREAWSDNGSYILICWPLSSAWLKRGSVMVIREGQLL